MKITTTLFSYLAKTYLRNMLFLLFGLLMIVYLFDTVELIRRGSKFDDVPFTLILKMGLFKLPEVGQVLLPFAILFSAMFTFWQLTKRSELVVVRAAGFSVWQFLFPLVFVAMFFGLLQMAVINPVSALLIAKFERLENQFLKRKNNEIALFKEGLWLRQSIESSEHDDGYFILNAKKVSQPDWTLHDVAILFFDQQDTFTKRIQSRSAKISDEQWNLEHAHVFYDGIHDEIIPFITLPTQLTIADIEESFSSAETMSFWKLPSHIQTLEDTGFDAVRLRIHYQNLLSQPLMFAAMVLLAATVSMRPPRFQGGTTLIGLGIFIGFVVFFASSFLKALGASGQIPVSLAAWSPALTSLLFSLSVIMNQEDG